MTLTYHKKNINNTDGLWQYQQQKNQNAILQKFTWSQELQMDCIFAVYRSHCAYIDVQGWNIAMFDVQASAILMSQAYNCATLDVQACNYATLSV